MTVLVSTWLVFLVSDFCVVDPALETVELK